MTIQNGKEASLANALNSKEEIFNKINKRKLAVFLDYDGTLTPIVDRPEDAVLHQNMKKAVEELAEVCTVGIISGRDLRDVKKMVGIDELVYAGSHGFDISGPGLSMQHEKGRECKPIFDKIEKSLNDRLSLFHGVHIERKQFAIAVHYRHLDESKLHEFKQIVNKEAEKYEKVKLSPGKKILEFKPNVDWHKGKALFWLMEKLGLDGTFPLYLGDDMTDEDAFQAIKGNGTGILVGSHGDLTYADYTLKNQEEVKHFLYELIVFVKKGIHEGMENKI